MAAMGRSYAARMTASICLSQLVTRFQLVLFWSTTSKLRQLASNQERTIRAIPRLSRSQMCVSVHFCGDFLDDELSRTCVSSANPEMHSELR